MGTAKRIGGLAIAAEVRVRSTGSQFSWLIVDPHQCAKRLGDDFHL